MQSVAVFAIPLIAYLGWRIIFLNSPILLRFSNSNSASLKLRLNSNYKRDRRETIRQSLGATFILAVVFALSLLITTSLEISLSLALISSSAPFLIARQRSLKKTRLQEKAWPEAIDYLISSLHSGRSITESVVDLKRYGPDELKQTFARVNLKIEGGDSIERALHSEMEFAMSAIADQVLTALIFAKEFGGSDVTNSLRLLATFLRDDAQIQEEIETRFGWVKNSALLGAVAPWLLLALLSMQRTTVEAFSSATGRTVLMIGLIATGIAFIWMERISRLPQPARPFRRDSGLAGQQARRNATGSEGKGSKAIGSETLDSKAIRGQARSQSIRERYK